jgi:hypothetical protein
MNVKENIGAVIDQKFQIWLLYQLQSLFRFKWYKGMTIVTIHDERERFGEKGYMVFLTFTV